MDVIFNFLVAVGWFILAVIGFIIAIVIFVYAIKKSKNSLNTLSEDKVSKNAEKSKSKAVDVDDSNNKHSE